MALDKTAVSNVTERIDESIEAIGYALDRIRDCGLDSSKRRMLEEHVRESSRLLYKALAIFY